MIIDFISSTFEQKPCTYIALYIDDKYSKLTLFVVYGDSQ